MKKVLVIANLFLSSTRMRGLMKYLPEYGWQPVLLAPLPPPGAQYPPEMRVITTPSPDSLRFWKRLFKIPSGGDVRSNIKDKLGAGSSNHFIDFLLTCAGAVINYPDSDKGWKSFAVAAGDKLLKEEKFDAILSSSAPVTAHIIAAELKSRAGLPWLADLRDPWSQNQNYTYGPVRRWLDKRLEVKTLGKAGALVIVSAPWAENLKALHQGKPAYAVTNAFDPSLLNCPSAPLTQKLTITYTGMIYQSKQDPGGLLDALRALIDEQVIDPDKVEVRFYGITGNWLNREIEKRRLQDIVKKYNGVSPREAVDRQRESHILLLLNWNDPAEKGTIPGKVFEYMAALRPILATGGAPDDAIQQILKETGAGYHAATAADIKNWLRERYTEYVTSGQVSGTIDESAIASYSQREMARRFADILEGITGNRAGLERPV